MGCGGLVSGGALVQSDALPPSAARICAAPGEIVGSAPLSLGAVEVALGRVGDELLRCGAEKAALVAWASGVQADLAGAAR
jgi:hypothetical protein